MGHRLVTASIALVLYDSSNRTNKIKLTSVIASPVSEACVSAYVTLYNATAATANTEFMILRCGTSARSVTWNDRYGIDIQANVLFVAVNSAFATIVWE